MQKKDGMQRRTGRQFKRKNERHKKELMRKHQDIPEFFGLGNGLAIYLVKNDLVDDLISLVNQKEINLQYVVPDTGKNLLHVATENNHSRMTTFLIKQNVSVSQRSHIDGRTCLHNAAANNNQFMVADLIAAGANPLIEDYAGKKASDLTKDIEFKQYLLGREDEARERKRIKFNLFNNIISSKEDMKEKVKIFA